MKYRIFYAERVKTDLDNILDYIAADNPGRAVTYIEEIQTIIEHLADFPFMGAMLRGNRIKSRNRQLIHGNHKIVYQVQEDRIYIKYVKNCAQKD